jgi:hypothetical protein
MPNIKAVSAPWFFLKRCWNDPVWSKTIAGFITLLLSHLLYFLWSSIVKLPLDAIDLFTTRTSIPNWFLAFLFLLSASFIVLLSVTLWKLYFPPIKTLHLSAKPEGNCWWGIGRIVDEPAMHIVGSTFVTNITSVPVRIPQVQLRYGFLGRKRVSGMGMVSRTADENMYGMYDIPPNETRDLTFDFWVYPPVFAPSKPFVAQSVVIFDQFGNEHKVRHVVFGVRQAAASALPKEPEEFPYEIADPIEKEVVSVLKAEVGRYQMCGRISGGLGSVHIVYRDRTFTGVGGDSWTPNSPVNQLIVADPEVALLKSDNLAALLGFHKGLESDAERARFIAALLDRLDAKRGDLGISYFIVCVLCYVGHLDGALQKAKSEALST